MLVAGCATIKTDGFDCYGYFNPEISLGYRDQKISENIYRVWYAQDGSANPKAVIAYAYRRASEVCLKAGFKHFVVVSSYFDKRDFGLANDDDIIRLAEANQDFSKKAQWVEGMSLIPIGAGFGSHTGSKILSLLLATTGVGIPFSDAIDESNNSKESRMRMQAMLLIMCSKEKPANAQSYDASVINAQFN